VGPSLNDRPATERSARADVGSLLTTARPERSVKSDEIIRYGFTGHETFPFRYPWPAKGVRAASAHPCIFGEEDATVTLGVGKNMVKAIRHWCLA